MFRVVIGPVEGSPGGDVGVVTGPCAVVHAVLVGAVIHPAVIHPAVIHGLRRGL